MKIGILFNCQGHGIATALEHLIPGAEARGFHLRHANAPLAEQQEILAWLLTCDHVITAPTRDDLGLFGTARLRAAVRRLHVILPINFRGFHPDTLYVDRPAGGHLEGPTGPYLSRIATAAYLAGFSVADTLALYNTLVFRRLGYLRAYEEDFALMQAGFGRLGIDITTMIARLRAAGCFMHSINHPRIMPLVELARLACGLMGITPADIDPESVPDELSRHATHAIYPEIAAAIGIAPTGMFRDSINPVSRPVPVPLSLEEFVAGNFAAFGIVDPGALQRADGVRAATETLRLRPARTLALAGQEMALLSRHGAVLASAAPDEAEPASFAQHDLTTWRDGIEPLRVLIDRRGLPAQPHLPGITLAETPRPDHVALRRGAQYLSADPGASQARFFRDAAGDAESFYPVPPGVVPLLAQLMQSAWEREDRPGIPLGAPEFLPGPVLSFGAESIDLHAAWPRALLDGRGGVPRLSVILSNLPVVLRRTGPRPQAEAAAASTTGTAAPADAAAPPPPPSGAPLPKPGPEPGRPLLIPGAPALLPPPITLSAADRAWLHATAGEAGLPWRAADGALAIHRETQRGVTFPWVDGLPPPAPPSRPDPADALAALVEAPPGTPDGGAPVWVDALLRLMAVTPHMQAPPRALVPAEPRIRAALNDIWRARDFGLLTWQARPAAGHAVPDVILPVPAEPWRWPPQVLRAMQAALTPAPLPPAEGRVLLDGGAPHRLANWIETLAALQASGFTAADGRGTAAAALAETLRAASLLVGTGPVLRAALFCQPSARVIELCADTGFDPATWRLCCALGHSHAVLPCPATPQGLKVPLDRLAALVRLMEFRLAS